MNLSRVRDDFPPVARVGYLNTGTLGPMPWPVVQKFQQMVEDYHHQGPAVPGAGETIRVKAAECRERLASLLGAKREEIALMESTSAGVNAALLSIAWEPGDEIITTDIEHAAVSIAIHHLQSRYWAKPVVVASRQGNVTAAQIEEAITRRTKAICLSHVSYCTGGRLPIEEIARVAGAHRLVLVVDGAQAAGAVDVSLDELGCHFYAFPGYKWLLGPEGTAGLFVRTDVAKVSLVSQAGFRGVNFTGPGGNYEPAGGARRFELSTMSGLNFAALSDSLDYFESVGASRTYTTDHDAALSSAFKRLLSGTPGVTVLTPEAAAESGALVAFTVAGVEGPDALDRAVRWLLNERRILIGSVRQTEALRASFHLYNTFDEVEALAAAVRELAAAVGRWGGRATAGRQKASSRRRSTSAPASRRASSGRSGRRSPARRGASKSKHKGLPRIRARFVLTILGVFLLAYYGQILIQGVIGFMLKTQVVKADYAERTVSGQGFILRQDNVVVAPVAGQVEWLVQEGERVRAGTPVARLVNPQARTELQKRLATLDADLALWDRDNRAQQTQNEAELTTLNRQLYDQVALWRESLATPSSPVTATGGKTNVTAAGTLAHVAEAAAKRRSVAFKATTLSDERAVLQKERDATAELLRKAALEISAPVVGVVSHKFDGLEEAMTIPSGEPPEPSKLLAAKPKDSEARAGDKLNPGQRLFRVTDMAKIMVAVVLPDRDMVEFSPGEPVSVRLSGAGAAEFKAHVTAVGERDQTGMGVVLLATSDFNPDLYKTRQDKVTVFRRSRQGPGVLKSALITRDGLTGVYVVERGATVFHPVTILAASPTLAVVEGIPVGAEVVTNPWLVPKKGVRVR